MTVKRDADRFMAFRIFPDGSFLFCRESCAGVTGMADVGMRRE